MAKKPLFESDISNNIPSNKDQVIVNFYNFDNKLLYENKYFFENVISDATKDFLEKNIETLQKLFKKELNKNNIFYYIKKNDNLERIEDYNKTISFYIYNLQDTIALLYHNSSTTTFSNSFSLNIYIKYKYRYKHIIEKIEEYIINNTYLIGKPILNEAEYYLYNKYTKQLKIIKYSKEDRNNLQLKYYSSSDNYCNANNYLYIYENNYKYDNMDSNRLISIDLINNKINLISSNFPKRILHSMIYIPECYIFIIGGKNTKEVLIYKIKEYNINYKKYPYLLPYEVLEPSLIYINNKYLYIFENSTIDFKILRINLSHISPFEIIEIKNKKYIKMNQKFFGVVKNKNSILFLGGQMINLNNEINKNCFEFHYDTNNLVRSRREFQSFDINEKTFIPLGSDIYMQLIEYKKGSKYAPKILFFDGRIQEVEKSEKESMENKI